MRSELQYNLQKARALATELRVTFEELGEGWEEAAFDAGGIEGELDDMDPAVIGEGHVKITIEEFIS